jgi:hypothetical protein
MHATDACIRYAAASGSLDLLKLLHNDQGIQLPPDTSSAAAAYGHIDVLRWLQEVDFAFRMDTTTGAAAGGHPDALQWLLEQGRPRDVNLCGTAAYFGHLNILSSLQEQGLLPAPRQLSEALQIAGAQGHLGIAQWLRKRRVQWPAVLKYGDKPWTGATLEWARAKGCTAPTEVVEEDEEEN